MAKLTNDKVLVQTRISKKEYVALKKLAEQDRRSLASYIANAITDHLIFKGVVIK